VSIRVYSWLVRFPLEGGADFFEAGDRLGAVTLPPRAFNFIS